MTTMMGVPPVYLFMAQHERFPDADLSSLERAVVGGAPMPESLLETWAARGTAIVQGYGLTEAAPNVLCLPPEDAVRKIGYAGKPYPFVDVRLSAEGEVQVQGPNVFPGYWRNPEATAAAFTDDGWLRTGDVAEVDGEGFYKIKGRLKDMYISGGENVYPAEVEAVLHEHPQVADAAVVGVPHERWGEVRRRVRRRRRRRRGRADRVVRGAARPLQGAVVGALRRRDPAQLARQDPEAEPRRGGRPMTTVGADGRTLSARGEKTRQKLLARRRAGLRRSRLPRRVDREDHRGRGRRPGDVLSLLRVEEGVLRRARPRPQPPHPARDGRAVAEGDDPPRAGAARLQGLLLVRRRASRPLPHHPPVRVRVARGLQVALRPRQRAVRRGAPRGRRPPRARRRSIPRSPRGR